MNKVSEKVKNIKQNDYVLFNREYIINHILIGSLNDKNVHNEHEEWLSQMIREIRGAGYPFPDLNDDVFKGEENGINSLIYVFAMERDNTNNKKLLILERDYSTKNRYGFELLISSLYNNADGKHCALRLTVKTDKGCLFIHKILETTLLNDNQWPIRIPNLFMQTTIPWKYGRPFLVKDKEGHDVMFKDANDENLRALNLYSLEDTVLSAAKKSAISIHSSLYDDRSITYSSIWQPGDLHYARDYTWLLHFTAQN